MRSILSTNLAQVILVVFVAICLGGEALSESTAARARYEDLRKQYLKLRNTDTGVSKSDEWTKLGREFVRFVDQNPKFPDAAIVLMDASILYEKLYRRFGDDKQVRTATDLLDRIARDYPGHMLADDALVRRGDLLLSEMGDIDGAERSYLEVVEAYPKSDMFLVARARLGKIDGTSSEEEASQPGQLEKDIRKPGKPLIVIDPGHGGEDFGAVGQGGLMEKDVVLAVALQLEKMLTEELGAVVRLTRRGDVFVPLMDRTMMANDFEADLFVSLHSNASPKKKLSGFEVYYLDNSRDKASKKLAERENASMRFEGAQSDLQFMLSDLIQNAKMGDSIALANTLQKSVEAEMSEKWEIGKSLGVKKAPFYVLVGAHMPCVLVEMFFIDNAKDGKNLAKKGFRRDLARGLFTGIKEFLERSEQS